MTLKPGDSPEVMKVQQVPLPVGTPVHFQKVDAVRLEPVLFTGNVLAGGFVHAAVGTKAYVYDPDRVLLVAEDLPGNVHYTGNTSQIDRIECRDGVYYLYTISKSVYKIVVGEGELVLFQGEAPPVQSDITAVNVRIQHLPPPDQAGQTVQYDRWWWLKAIRDALSFKKKKK